jgi:hypothetical protein
MQRPDGRARIESVLRTRRTTRGLLKHAMTEYNLSARTIAVLRGAEKISGDDVSEAIQFRALDRQLWG